MEIILRLSSEDCNPCQCLLLHAHTNKALVQIFYPPPPRWGLVTHSTTLPFVGSSVGEVSDLVVSSNVIGVEALWQPCTVVDTSQL